MAKSVDQSAPVKIELGKNILRSLLGLKATLYEGLSHFLKGARVILLLFFGLQIDQSRKKGKMVERGKVHVWPYLVKEAENGAIVV